MLLKCFDDTVTKGSMCRNALYFCRLMIICASLLVGKVQSMIVSKSLRSFAAFWSLMYYFNHEHEKLVMNY